MPPQTSPLTWITPAAHFKNVTASGIIYSGSGALVGIVVNSNTNGTIKVYNGLDATGVVMFNTITIAAGERFINLGGAQFGQGCYFTITGTCDITALYN